MQAPTRLCSGCTERKTVRGIWYLVSADEGSVFFCESCYSRATGPRAGSPALRAPRMPEAPAHFLAGPPAFGHRE